MGCCQIFRFASDESWLCSSIQAHWRRNISFLDVNKCMHNSSHRLTQIRAHMQHDVDCAMQLNQLTRPRKVNIGQFCSFEVAHRSSEWWTWNMARLVFRLRNSTLFSVQIETSVQSIFSVLPSRYDLLFICKTIDYKKQTRCKQEETTRILFTTRWRGYTDTIWRSVKISSGRNKSKRMKMRNESSRFLENFRWEQYA